MALAILNIGPFELLIVAAAAIMLLGGDLPDTARKAARLMGRLRSLASELGREFTPPPELRRPPRLDLDVDLGLDEAAKLPDDPAGQDALRRPKEANAGTPETPTAPDGANEDDEPDIDPGKRTDAPSDAAGR